MTGEGQRQVEVGQQAPQHGAHALLAGDELARELQEHVRAETAPYKYPRIVEFADALPKTPSGKIRRAELR